MKARDGLQSLRSGWWLVAIGLLLGLLAAHLVLRASTPLYRSSTELFVAAQGSTGTTSAAYTGNLFTQQRVASYVRLIEGERLSSAVVDDLELSMTPGELAGQVTARVLPRTVILEISVTDASPRRAQLIASAYGRHVIEDITALERPDPDEPSAVAVSTVEEANRSSSPVSPDPVRDYAAGALLGLLLGVALAVLRWRTRPTVTTSDDVEAATGTAVLAAVTDDRGGTRRPLADLLDPHAAGPEELRLLRTRVFPAGDSDPPGIVVVTGARREDGASTVAVQFATALARAGGKVLLVDADLRSPALSRSLGLAGAEGLADVLAGTAHETAVIQDPGDGRPAVLPAGADSAGGPRGDSGELLLAAPKMRALLDTLCTAYDTVVIDSPPVLPGGSAGSIGALGQGCLLVCRYGSTRRTRLAEAAGTLSWYGATLLGVVLTGVPERRAVAQGYRFRYSPETPRPRTEPMPAPVEPDLPAAPDREDGGPAPTSSAAGAGGS